MSSGESLGIFLKVEPKRFANGFDVGYERRGVSRMAGIVTDGDGDAGRESGVWGNHEAQKFGLGGGVPWRSSG